MASVKKHKGESFEDMLKRFRKTCRNEGVLAEIRYRECFEKPCDRRRRKQQEGIRNTMKRSRRRRSFN